MAMAKYGYHFGNSDMDRYGLFAEMDYMLGNKYTPVLKFTNVRDLKGRQMYPGVPKMKTDLQDCYFDQEFKRIFEREGWSDLSKREKKARLESKKLNVSPFPFYPSSYTKKHATPGDNFGTFDKERIAFSPKKNPAPPKTKEPRGFYTNPGKKGGMGYIDTTIGKFPEYMSSKYEGIRGPAKEKRKPFRGAGPCQPYFGADPYTAPPTKTYNTLVDKKYALGRPFMPTSPGKPLGGSMSGCFDKWPKHSNEKYIPPYLIDKKFDEMLRSRRRGKPKPISEHPFAPQGRNKTMPTCSIVGRNVDISIKMDNWREMKPVTYTKEFFA